MFYPNSEIVLSSPPQQSLSTPSHLASSSFSTPCSTDYGVIPALMGILPTQHTAATSQRSDATPTSSIATRVVSVTSGTRSLSDCELRPSPLHIPEVLQEICHYLDRPALVHVSRVSRRFWACSAPLLWTAIPDYAWKNHYFRANWHRYGSQIMTLSCGPGVDLGLVSLYCSNLISLDVSKIRGPIRAEGKGDMANASQVGYQGRAPTKTQYQQRMEGKANSDKQSNQDFLVDNYSSFLRMTDGLIQVIQNNRSLRCLQLRPIGRLPPQLLEALSRLNRLEFLSLNAWSDFQEYSLQLVMEACPGLSHLSLGENDFTRFTLETLQGSNLSPRLPKLGLPCAGKPEIRVRLERYDDPIKGRAGPYVLDHDPIEIHSKRAVYDTQSIPYGHLDHHTLPHIHHQHLYQQSTTAPQIHIKTLSLHQAGLRQEFLVKLTSLCPRLEHLSLLNGWGFYPSTRFASILSQSCPNLSRLEFREQALDLQDEFFVSLCRHIPRLQWIHAGMTGFSNGALDSVRAHCKDIVSLNLDGTRGIQSKALDQLLRVCSSLKTLSARGVVLNARDMVRESKWACRGLETLVLDIEIYAATTEPQSVMANSGGRMSVPTMSHDCVKTVRECVYDQLADLTRLRLLGLGGGHPVRGAEPTVDLTLESGLQKLKSLHCLERLDIRRMVRTQSEQDMAWMVQHWPRFCYLEASKGRTYKNGNDKTYKAIEWLSQTRPGMRISLI
ncbi:hypothetical protein BGX26_000242 [Mortierella sp. AD094]|nr:hypothetical protein BGX26_000242 [Mortierella sp. AD094]